MASNTKNVKLGVCRVYFGETEEDLGLTKGGVDVSVSTETHEVTVDQYGDTPINEYITSRHAEVTVPMAETTLENAVKIMPGARLLTDAEDPNKRYVEVPTGTGMSLMNYAQRLRLHPIANADDDREDDFILYRAATPGEINYSYKLDEERIFSCTFKGYPDDQSRLFAMGDITALADGSVPPVLSPNDRPISNVWPAIVHDNSELDPIADDQIVKGYKVTAVNKANTSYVTVTIEGTDLQEHQDEQKREGYWIGFAVLPPEPTVDGSKGAFDDSKLSTKQPLQKNVYNGKDGVAVYINHKTDNMPIKKFTLQWMKGEQNFGAPVVYQIDTSAVKNKASEAA